MMSAAQDAHMEGGWACGEVRYRLTAAPLFHPLLSLHQMSARVRLGFRSVRERYTREACGSLETVQGGGGRAGEAL